MNNNYPLIYRLSDANTTDYTALTNKPTINTVSLTGDLSSSDLGIANATDVGTLTDLTTTEQSSIVGAINEIDGDTATLAAKFPVAIADGGTGGTTATEARTSLGVMTGVQLYYNASGSSGTIDLSDNIQNYQIIEIYFIVSTSDDFYHSIRVYTGGATSVLTAATINIGGSYNTSRRLRAIAGNMLISQNQLTHTRDVHALLTGSSSFETIDTTTDTPKIYKIIGYKY